MREVAQEEREALGLGPFDKFDPYALAEAHGIFVYALSELQKWGLGEQAHSHFYELRSGTWSAALIPLEHSRLIVEHDGHAEVRRRSSIAHELGHHLLEHPFDTALLGDDHMRRFDRTREKEADFIAGELLLPQEAARRAAFEQWGNAQVARTYGISAQLAQKLMSGARIFADRAARKQARRP